MPSAVLLGANMCTCELSCISLATLLGMLQPFDWLTHVRAHTHTHTHTLQTTAGTVATKDKIIFSSEDEAENNGGDALISPKEKPRKLSLGTGTGFPSAELTSLAHPLVKRVIHVERESLLT